MHLRSLGRSGSLSDGRASALVREYPVRFCRTDMRYDYAYFLLTTLLFSITELPHRIICRTRRNGHRIPRFPRIFARGFNDADGSLSFANLRTFKEQKRCVLANDLPRDFSLRENSTVSADFYFRATIIMWTFFPRDYFSAPRFFTTFRRPRHDATRRGPPRVATGRH